ncbi:Thermostable beta-glucosidase B [termite gut metagenome]
MNTKTYKRKKEKYGSNESIGVTFELKNTGEREADEVVQLYVHRLGAAIEWPFKELKAFERVTLKGGESQTVTLTIPVNKLRYWNEENQKWLLEHSEIELLLGSSSSD